MLEDVKATIEEEIERRRSEFEDSLKRHKVGDPITAVVLTTAFWVSAGASVALSIATGLITRALTPRQKITVGDMGGQDFRFQRSAQGTGIPEIYGADPGDGLGGGVKISPVIAWLSKDANGYVARKHSETTRGGGGGKMGPKPPDTTTISYDLDVLLLWGRGPLVLKRLWAATDILYQTITGQPTGVPDPTVDPDDDYPFDLPPNALTPYTRPTDRYSGALLVDGTDAQAGTIVHGNGAGIAIYEGNGTELPDPVVEAAVDALHGVGSTTAYRRNATTRLSQFYLTRYQSAFPPMSGLLEHKTIHTLEDLFAHFCERVGLTSDDYDFSDLASIDVRGFVVGPPYSPKEVMTELARIFGVYFYESDKIYGLRYSSAPTFALDDSDLGWVDGDAGDESVLPELSGGVPVETDIPRRVSLRCIEPARNYDDNLQGEVRQVTTGQREDVLELSIVMTADEAREVVQRELYRMDVEAAPHSFTLSYEHIYRNPGDIAVITRDEGFTHSVRIASMKPTLGAIECEGFAVDTAIYTQPVSTDAGGFEIPPFQIPGMTLLGIYDGPLLSDEHNTINNGSGMYVWATKRYGDGEFGGSALYVDKGLGFELIETFDKQATFGVCVTALTADTTVHDVVADALTIDLHPDDHTLESFTREDLMAGAGPCIVGREVGQIHEANREPDTATFPNRWYLTIGLRGRRGTDFAINDHVEGEPFVLINNAIKFLPLNLNDLNVERTYKMVTAGQSLDDAANVTFVWTGGSRKELSPVHARRSDDSAGNSLIEFDDRERLGHGVHTGQSGFTDNEVRRFEVELTDSSFAPLSPSLVIPVTVGEVQRAVMESYGEDASYVGKFTNVTVNTIAVSGSVVTRTVRALQQIRQENNYAEATLKATSNGIAQLGFHAAFKDWRTDEPDFSILMDASVLEVREGTTLLYTESSTAYATAGKRVRIDLIGSRVVFSRYLGELLVEVASSTIPATFPLHVWGNVSTGSSGTASLNNLVLTTSPDPKAVLTQAQKTEHGIGSPVYANIYKISPLVGRGFPAEVVLINSL